MKRITNENLLGFEDRVVHHLYRQFDDHYYHRFQEILMKTT